MLIGIIQRLPYPQGTSCHFQEGQAVALGVPGDLEDPGAEFFRQIRTRRKRGQRVQQFPDAVQLQAGAEEAGEERAFRNQGGEQSVVRRLSLQEGVHRGFAAQGDLFLKVRGPAAEVHAAGIQAGAQFLHQGALIRPGKVHFGHKQEGGDPAALQKPPQRFRMRLYAVRAGNHQHGAVHHREAPFHLGRKVHVAGGVQQGDAGVLPVQHGLFGKDGDAPLPFQAVGVEEAVPVIHPALLLHGPGKNQHGLGQGGLPGVHMGDEPDAEVLPLSVLNGFRHVSRSLSRCLSDERIVS